MTFAKYSERGSAQNIEAKRLSEIMATPHDAPPKVLFMLTVYLDESGQESPEHVVIAGFIGADEQWKAVIPNWKMGLGPQRRSLHMRELYWSKPYTQGLLARLASIPYKHNLIPVVGAVRVSDYADLLLNPAEEWLASGYALALYPVIVDILRAFPESETIKWVFEEQQTYEPLARTIFANFRHYKCQERLAGLEFVPKGYTCLTELSDYLAYATIQDLRDPASQKAQWCSPIIKKDKQLGMVVDRDNIRELLGSALPAAALKTMLETRADLLPDPKKARALLGQLWK
jgi:hypothetical protein